MGYRGGASGEYQPLSEKNQPNGYAGLNADGKLEGPIILTADTAANLAGVTLSQGEIALETDLERLLAGDGSTAGGFDAAWGAGGTVVVRPTEDHADNASKLTQAYSIAKTLTPGGSALSASNRAAVVLLPGKYDYGANAGLVLDTSYVDLVGVGHRDQVVLNSNSEMMADGFSLKLAATHVRIANLKLTCDLNEFLLHTNRVLFWLDGVSMADSSMRNVNFDQNATDKKAMNDGQVFDGTYVDCVACESAFGSRGTASGLFVRCECGDLSFGAGGIASGTFRDCVGGHRSFGSEEPGGSGFEASGMFIRCQGGEMSFGYTASGVFVDCIGQSESFGFDVATGSFQNCRAEFGSFGRMGFSGVAYGCFGGQYSFAGRSGAILSGECYDCHVPGGQGFAALGTLTGACYGCSTTVGGFGISNATGAGSKMIGCTIFNATYGLLCGGLMERCTIEVAASNSHCITVVDGARVYDCTLIASGTGMSVAASSNVHVRIAHCRMNNGIGTNVTNDIEAPCNVVDADITA
jgi:hypothetical protein